MSERDDDAGLSARERVALEAWDAVEPPAGFEERVLRAARSGLRPRRVAPPRGAVLAMAAAAALVVAIGAWWIAGPRDGRAGRGTAVAAATGVGTGRVAGGGSAASVSTGTGAGAASALPAPPPVMLMAPVSISVSVKPPLPPPVPATVTAAATAGGSASAAASVTSSPSEAEGADALGAEASAVSVAGGLERPVVLAGVHVGSADLRTCYERSLATDPAIEGNMEIHFVVDEAGAVESATAATYTVRSEGMRRCVIDVVSRWRFPRPPAPGKTEVLLPLAFKRAPR